MPAPCFDLKCLYGFKKIVGRVVEGEVEWERGGRQVPTLSKPQGIRGPKQLKSCSVHLNES